MVDNQLEHFFKARSGSFLRQKLGGVKQFCHKMVVKMPPVYERYGGGLRYTFDRYWRGHGEALDRQRRHIGSAQKDCLILTGLIDERIHALYVLNLPTANCLLQTACCQLLSACLA
jgi:hypothetical protein